MASPERALIDDLHGDPEQQNETFVSKKDSRYSWFVCGCGFVSQVFILGVLHAFGVFFVEFIKEFKVSKSEAAWVGSLAYGLSMTFGPVVSIMLKKFGNRAIMVSGCIICAISVLGSSFVTRLPQMFGSFSFLYGIGTCMSTQPTMTIAPKYFDKYLSVAIGLMTAGSSVGTLVMAPLSQSLIDSIGWRNAFRFFTGTSLFCACCGLFIVPLDDETQDERAETVERVRSSPLRQMLQELRLWKNRVFIVWTLAITSVMFGFYIPYVHLVSYAIDVGISPEKGSIIVMLFGACTAVGRVSFGKIVQLGFLNRLHMHQVSMVITGTGVMLLPMIKSFSGIVAYVIIVGLVDGCYVVLLPVLTTTLMGAENTIVAWGFLIGTSSITFTLGPPMAGALYDALGSYNVAFHCAGIPIIGGAVILFFIPWAQRTNRAYEFPVQPMNGTQNEYDFTEDLLYGPRETLPAMSASTLNSEPVIRGSDISLKVVTPTRDTIKGARKRLKSYKDQSTATSPGSLVYVPMDMQDALKQLEKTRKMLETVLNASRVKEDTSKRSRSELIQTQNQPEHVLTNAASIMSVPVGMHMCCSRCHQPITEQNSVESRGVFDQNIQHRFSPSSQTQLSMTSSLQSRNLSDYQVNTDSLAGAVGGNPGGSGCLSPERRVYHLTSGRSTHHIPFTQEHLHTRGEGIDKDDTADFDRAIMNQVETLRETLRSPTKNASCTDDQNNEDSYQGIHKDFSSEFQLVESSDLEPVSVPVYHQDSTFNKRESNHCMISPKLEVIEEVPVSSGQVDNVVVQADMSSEAVETWLKNSPNDPSSYLNIDRDSCSSDKDESLASECTINEENVSQKSSPGGEIDVFTHLFDDNDNAE